MKSLLATLHDCDPGMLPALAETWSVDGKSLSKDELIRQLQRIMLDPTQAEAAWDKLDEPARAALQLLVSSAGSRMKVAQFERFYGEIRKLGRAQIKREQPHLHGQSLAETLYYRGFIGEGFDKVDERLIGFVYVPTDLIEALPLHKTSFGELAAQPAPEGDELPRIGLVDEVGVITEADTTIIDDMTTLLSLLQADARPLDGYRFANAAAAAIKPLLLRQSDARLAFMLGVGLSADLIARAEDKAQPSRNQARAWLEASRAEQIRALARAWLDSQIYRDMWHIPGLYPEESGWAYDAASARKTVMELLGDLLPEQGWGSITELIEIIKEFEPDFQRLDGDYDQWYIRNDAGEYLSGFESWDAVEGSLIEFYIVGPMHWLGLADIGEDALRLTAYGRAFLGRSEWPRPQEQTTRIEVRQDGQLLASRLVNRFERFQLARFARCAAAGDPYIYTLDAPGIQRAAAQGITTQHINAFVSRQLEGKPMPLPIVMLLRNWQEGAKTSVSFEALTVLRATAESTLDKIFAIPALRRYLGARLGPMACVVRDGQWQALQAQLVENGIEVDISRLDGDSD